MVQAENNRVELIRNKQECKEVKGLLEFIINQLEGCEGLTDQEKERLETCKKDMVRVSGMEKTIDFHLKKFLQ